MSKRVIVTGGTGFIGRSLSALLIERGYEVVVLSRDPEKVASTFGGKASGARWQGRSADAWAGRAEGAHAIVNLAGDNIAAGRWTTEKKRRILESRLEAGHAVLEAVERASARPAVLVQASAIGYYGDRGEEVLDELSARGEGFLSRVCAAWEASTRDVETLGVRRAVIRTAPVLGARGGFLDRIVPLFRKGLGGYMGSGRQWSAWIHLRDEIEAIAFLLEREDLSGVFNLASPAQTRNKEFYQTLGRVLGRPARVSVPPFFLRLALGEVARELILPGQRVIPRRLLEAGFNFSYPELEPALREFL